MSAIPWRSEPHAAWSTPQAFTVGGAVDQRTEHLLRAHGARCLTMWRNSLHRFAEGQPVTTAMMERHNRQSLDHWAFARAAALVQADARFDLRKPEISEQKTGKKAGSVESAKPSDTARIRRALGWGRR